MNGTSRKRKQPEPVVTSTSSDVFDMSTFHKFTSFAQTWERDSLTIVLVVELMFNGKKHPAEITVCTTLGFADVERFFAYAHPSKLEFVTPPSVKPQGFVENYDFCKNFLLENGTLAPKFYQTIEDAQRDLVLPEAIQVVALGYIDVTLRHDILGMFIIRRTTYITDIVNKGCTLPTFAWSCSSKQLVAVHLIKLTASVDGTKTTPIVAPPLDPLATNDVTRLQFPAMRFRGYPRKCTEHDPPTLWVESGFLGRVIKDSEQHNPLDPLPSTNGALNKLKVHWMRWVSYDMMEVLLIHPGGKGELMSIEVGFSALHHIAPFKAWWETDESLFVMLCRPESTLRVGAHSVGAKLQMARAKLNPDTAKQLALDILFPRDVDTFDENVLIAYTEILRICRATTDTPRLDTATFVVRQIKNLARSSKLRETPKLAANEASCDTTEDYTRYIANGVPLFGSGFGMHGKFDEASAQGVIDVMDSKGTNISRIVCTGRETTAYTPPDNVTRLLAIGRELAKYSVYSGLQLNRQRWFDATEEEAIKQLIGATETIADDQITLKRYNKLRFLDGYNDEVVWVLYPRPNRHLKHDVGGVSESTPGSTPMSVFIDIMSGGIQWEEIEASYTNIWYKDVPPESLEAFLSITDALRYAHANKNGWYMLLAFYLPKVTLRDSRISFQRELDMLQCTLRQHNFTLSGTAMHHNQKLEKELMTKRIQFQKMEAAGVFEIANTDTIRASSLMLVVLIKHSKKYVGTATTPSAPFFRDCLVVTDDTQ